MPNNETLTIPALQPTLQTPRISKTFDAGRSRKPWAGRVRDRITPAHAAFVLDPDGNNIEAVFHGPANRSAESVVITPA
jgi:hypothetical protein